MIVSLTAKAISPVLLILALGFYAGRKGLFDRSKARALSYFALHFALPAALFLSMANMSSAELISQLPIMAIMLVGYTGYFFLLFGGLLKCGMPALWAVLLAYTVSSTATPIYGLTILVPLFGAAASASIVGLAALVTNLAQVSVVIFLLKAFAPLDGVKPSVAESLRNAVSNPLVWCPVLGAVVSLSNIHLPDITAIALKPLASCAAGGGIFACGLVLSGTRLNLLSRTVLLGTIGCIIVQPVIFWGLLHFMHVSHTLATALMVASVLPTATPTVLFAQSYEESEAEIAAIMLVTTIAMLVTVPAILLLSGMSLV